jgi:hypothetical protein
MTAQMNESVITELKVRGIIEVLRSLTKDGDTIDGETMLFILESIGLTDQMLRQLIMSNPESDTYDLLEEKAIFNMSLLKQKAE